MVVAFLPFGRDDTQCDIVRIFGGRFDDMRVGDDPRRRDRNAAAMAEPHNLAIDHRHGDDAHDAARCGADIVGRVNRQDEGEEGEQQGKQAGHGAEPSRSRREGKRG